MWQAYIEGGVAEGVRADGRRREGYRAMRLLQPDAGNTNGAARVQLGETDVVVGVKSVPPRLRPCAAPHRRTAWPLTAPLV